MVVEPKVGAGNLKFGMLQEEVKALLGEPETKERESWPDASTSEEWEYLSKDLNLVFSEEEEWKLVTITLMSADTELFGCRVIGVAEDEALRMLQDAGSPAFVLDEENVLEEPAMRPYECEALEVSLLVSGGVVESMTLFPAFDDTGESPVWPKAEQEV